MCGRVAQYQGPVEYGSMLKIDWTKTLSSGLPKLRKALVLSRRVLGSDGPSSLRCAVDDWKMRLDFSD